MAVSLRVSKTPKETTKKYVLKKGESLKRRVGILVHCGDVKAGQVARRYKMRFHTCRQMGGEPGVGPLAA